MKKLFVIMALILVFSLTTASASDPYNEPLSMFARTNKAEIPENAINVPPGTYSCPEDIPAGNYQIDTDCYGSHFILYQKKDVVFTVYFGKNYGETRIAYIPVSEGNSIKVEKNPVYFSPSSFSCPTCDQFILAPGFYVCEKDLPLGSFLASQEGILPSTVSIKTTTWPSKTVFSGDIGPDSKLDFSEDCTVCVYDSSISLKKFVSPFF
jgi:hypothetical protein